MPRPPILKTLKHGLKTRCPRCGAGRLFKRWIALHERCSACGLIYQRNQGDIWMWILITDRVPILLGIAAVYFGFRATTWVNALGFMAALAVPMVATMPNRQGLAVALDYLSRIYLPDAPESSEARDTF